jgi:hypothetical protein
MKNLNNRLYKGDNMKLKESIAGLISAAILLSASSVVLADEEFKVDFTQTYVVTNEDSSSQTPEIPSSHFYVTEVQDASILNISTVPGINNVNNGNPENVAITDPDVAFSDTVPANTENYQVDYPVELVFNDNVATGVYRYELHKTTGDLDEFCYFDVYIFTDETAVNFYESSNFSNAQVKIIGFTDNYLIEQGEVISYNYTSIIQFQLEDGTLIHDDISLGYSVTNSSIDNASIRKLSARPTSRVLSASRVNFAETANDISFQPALDEYETVLAQLLASGYEVVKDEVAENTSGIWFSNDPNETLIFHIYMKIVDGPTITPEPTATPTPSEPKTGDDFNPVYYTILAIVSILGLASSVIYIHSKKIKKNKDEEN